MMFTRKPILQRRGCAYGRLRQRQRFARLANRDIASVLADTIQNSIPNISEAATTLQPISLLSDADVLALTELQMEPAQDLQLSELLVGVAYRRVRFVD
jgi:hypothetical protein